MQVQICEDAGVVGVVVPSHPGNWGELPKICPFSTSRYVTEFQMYSRRLF